MKYMKILTAVLALLCLLCACNAQKPPIDHTQPITQTGTAYQSSWTVGISKASAEQNHAVAEWIALCASTERDGIGHYVLHNVTDNGDDTSTHHFLLYRSATEFDAASFTVEFAADEDFLTVTPTYTSSTESAYGYDLIYLTLTAKSELRVLVEMLVDGDYPGQIVTKTQEAITPDTFGAQGNE